MDISSLGKVIAALALVGSLSLPAFADKSQQDLHCFQELEGITTSDCGPSSSVPEPGMLGLLGLGLVGIAIARRRK